MRGVNLATFEQCILLLADIYTYAENDDYKKKALAIIKNLWDECSVNSLIINDIYNKSGKLQLIETHKHSFGL